jgi:nitroreductase
MDLSEAIIKRVSMREYQATPVPEQKLNRVLEAGRMAPTGGNRQEFKIVVVKDAELRRKLAEASGGQKHVGQAPIVIAAVAIAPERMMLCGVPAYAVDVSIVIDHMTLAATNEGLSTCWIGAFNQDMVRTALKIPQSHMVVSLLTLGLAGGEGRPKTRKELGQLVCYDAFKA